jgi:hypothetical protein
MVRPVVPGGAGGAMAPPNFGKSVNPISTKGGSLCPLNNTGTPGFSDLPTALMVSHFITFLLGKQSFYKVFSNDSYDWLKFHIFAIGYV